MFRGSLELGGTDTAQLTGPVLHEKLPGLLPNSLLLVFPFELDLAKLALTGPIPFSN